MTDPIADMLTRIRNSVAIRKSEVAMPYSKLKAEIAKILEANGYISGFEKAGEGINAELKINLKYEDGVSKINSLVRTSKPGRRIYSKKDNLPIVLNNRGIAIISTSRGLMTNKEAGKNGLGGEVICEIY